MGIVGKFQDLANFADLPDGVLADPGLGQATRKSELAKPSAQYKSDRFTIRSRPLTKSCKSHLPN